MTSGADEVDEVRDHRGLLERVWQTFFAQLLAGTRQADQQAAAVLGIGAGPGQAKLAAARSSQLAYKLQAYIIFRRCEHVS
jgi:hypothetical protein